MTPSLASDFWKSMQKFKDEQLDEVRLLRVLGFRV